MGSSQELSDSELLRACDDADDMSDLWDIREPTDADLVRECERAEMEYHLGVTDEELLQVSVCVCVCVLGHTSPAPGQRVRGSIDHGEVMTSHARVSAPCLCL